MHFMKSQLNSNGWFSGKLLRPENIGKTSLELSVLWNKDHPYDLIPVEG